MALVWIHAAAQDVVFLLLLKQLQVRPTRSMQQQSERELTSSCPAARRNPKILRPIGNRLQPSLPASAGRLSQYTPAWPSLPTTAPAVAERLGKRIIVRSTDERSPYTKGKHRICPFSKAQVGTDSERQPTARTSATTALRPQGARSRKHICRSKSPSPDAWILTPVPEDQTILGTLAGSRETRPMGPSPASHGYPQRALSRRQTAREAQRTSPTHTRGQLRKTLSYLHRILGT